jgi:hypothetical protein
MANSLIPSWQEARQLLEKAAVFLLCGFARAGASVVRVPAWLRQALAV